MPTEATRRHLVQAYVTEDEYRSINQCGPYGQAILTSHNRYSDQPYSEDDFAAICRDAALAAGHIQKLADYDYPALERRPTKQWPFQLKVDILDSVNHCWQHGPNPETSSEWDTEAADAGEFFADFPELLEWVRNPEFDVAAAWSQRQPATAENVPSPRD